MLISMPVPSVLGKRACLLSFKYLKAKIGNKHLFSHGMPQILYCIKECVQVFKKHFGNSRVSINFPVIPESLWHSHSIIFPSSLLFERLGLSCFTILKDFIWEQHSFHSVYIFFPTSKLSYPVIFGFILIVSQWGLHVEEIKLRVKNSSGRNQFFHIPSSKVVLINFQSLHSELSHLKCPLQLGQAMSYHVTASSTPPAFLRPNATKATCDL